MPDLHDADAYADALAALLPPGTALEGFTQPGGTGRKLLVGLAGPLADAEAEAWRLLADLNPFQADITLGSRETEAGLPDDCTGQATTREERQAALALKWSGEGGQSVPYFKSVAERLGYEVEITEQRPFMVGMSQCGGTDWIGDERQRFWWFISVPGPRVTWFRVGVSELGADPLAKITRAEDLECLLNRLKPAYTKLTFSYEGN